MASIFLSYARNDMDVALKLEEILLSRNIRVWRDQESIYVGEEWPKAIGQAIENEKIFLLLWSKHAAESHFVEFEWNTALALKKTIAPVLLDDTPLPAALKAINGVSIEDTNNAINKILNTMAASPLPDHQQNRRVIDTLSHVKEKSVEAALDRIKTIYKQHGWQVYGNVYQVSGEHIHITSPETVSEEQKPKKWWEKWQSKVTFLVVLLTFLSLVFEIPEKAVEFYKRFIGEPPATCTLKGVVLDSKNMPVRGVEVRVDKLPDQLVKSSGSGSFKFEKVPGEVGDSVRVSAYYEGKMVYDEYVTLPGPVRIKLEDT